MDTYTVHTNLAQASVAATRLCLLSHHNIEDTMVE